MWTNAPRERLEGGALRNDLYGTRGGARFWDWNTRTLHPVTEKIRKYNPLLILCSSRVTVH